MPTQKQVVTDLFTEEKKPPIPEIDDIKMPDADKRRLDNLVRRRSAVTAQKNKLVAQEAEFNERVMKIFRRNKIMRVRVADHAAYIVSSGHTSIDENKLVEHGVSPKLIKKCKVYVPHKEYIRIDPPRGKKTTSDGE